MRNPLIRNDGVGGSNPSCGTTLRLRLRVAQPRKHKAKRARRSPQGEEGQPSASFGSAGQNNIERSEKAAAPKRASA